MELFWLALLAFAFCTLWLYALRAAFTTDRRLKVYKKLEDMFHGKEGQ
jgi:hypothetical protein